jgi:methionyl-tRNA synthetase
MPYESPDQVIFTYTALFSFSVHCGELLAQRRGWKENPFAPGSSCKTIAGFGIDNAIPYLVGVLGSAIELGTIRPFDYYLTNHFYQLEGKKFSTSRKHLVCARDLTEAGVDPDALRYFLAKVNPELGKRSFSANEFARCHNAYLHDEVGGRIDAALGQASGRAPGELPGDLAERFEELHRAQVIDLDFPRPNLERAVGTVDVWNLVGAQMGIGSTSHPSRAYWWLQGFAVLAAPFMPTVASELWRRLGHDGEPRPAAFTEKTTAATHSAPWKPFGRISSDRIEACMSYETGVRR